MQAGFPVHFTDAFPIRFEIAALVIRLCAAG